MGEAQGQLLGSIMSLLTVALISFSTHLMVLYMRFD